MENYLSFPDMVKAIWEILWGMLGVVIGYFLPIKDMVNFIVLLFIVDVALGYWTARKLRGEKFSVGIIWKTTVPRMALSILIVVLAYTWDTTFQQNYLETYNVTGWFISGILIFSIVKNAFKITNWQGFNQISELFSSRIKEKTGVDIQKTPENG